MACVVLKPGIVLTADELVAYCRQSLATFKIPRRVEFLDTELPKSGSGKILRRVLLTPQYSSKTDRLEVDGANTSRAFLREHHTPEQEIEIVWTAIALHTTPGIPQYMHPVIALLTAGVEMDVLGIGYSDFTEADRETVVRAYPRTEHFKEDIIQAFYDGIKHKPETTFGNVKADVLADKDPGFHGTNFCRVIRDSAWRG
jgi:hypothetical protein